MDAAIIKIGGSLALYPEKLKTLCTKLSDASNSHKILVVPGGAEFADAVREADKRFSLSSGVSHRMAILGMDQYGFLLSDLIAKSKVIDQFDQIQNALDLHLMPVFLPSNLMLKDDPLENSWEVTSDSIAVYLASRLRINKVVLVKDVDGIFTCDPKKYSDTQLINQLSIKQLEAMNKRTSVDKHLTKLLSQLQIECFIVNGLFPERLEAILNGQKTVCTLIH